MGAAAVALSTASGYVNAGTVELLVEQDGSFYFLEVNARLQVEHTVTEEVLGLDLVACQLKIAAGDPLGLSQSDITPQGHAIECRINAEDPAQGFIPTPGKLTAYTEPQGRGVRVDGGYIAGDEIPSAYDSLVAKVITSGRDREEARRRMIRALTEMHVSGVSTTIPAHLKLLEDPEFVAGTHTTRTVEDGGALDALVVPDQPDQDEAVLLVGGRPVRFWNPGMAPSATAAVQGGGGSGDAVAPMQGTILKVLVSEGDAVESGDALVVLEAMKMETVISAARSGIVAEVRVGPGDTAGAGDVLVALSDPSS
jgi:acetyl-CoA/propionyl-CoA carboxylase biotin carboxyl carrier protein